MDKQRRREPIEKAIAISLANKDLAVSLLTQIELVRQRLDAFQFAISKLLSLSHNDQSLQNAMSVIRGHLEKELSYAQSQLLSFAVIDEDVRELSKKAMLADMEKTMDTFSYLADGRFYERKDVRALIAAKLGVSAPMSEAVSEDPEDPESLPL